MKHTIEHSLPHQTARLVADKAFETYSARFPDYNPQATWVNDNRCEIAFSAKGVTLDGVLGLREGAIDIEMEVPFLFRPFRKRAIEIIEREINAWIARAESGEFDDDTTMQA